MTNDCSASKNIPLNELPVGRRFNLAHVTFVVRHKSRGAAYCEPQFDDDDLVTTNDGIALQPASQWLSGDTPVEPLLRVRIGDLALGQEFEVDGVILQVFDQSPLSRETYLYCDDDQEPIVLESGLRVQPTEIQAFDSNLEIAIEENMVIEPAKQMPMAILRDLKQDAKFKVADNGSDFVFRVQKQRAETNLTDVELVYSEFTFKTDRHGISADIRVAQQLQSDTVVQVVGAPCGDSLTMIGAS